jgi:oligoendopeptidase F
MSTSTVPFVPADLDPGSWAALEPLFDLLRQRPIATPAELERWLLDLSALMEAVDEYGSRRYIDMSCHTDDPAIEKAFLHFVEQIQPRLKPACFELQKKYLACPCRGKGALDTVRMRVLDRQWEQEVGLFRQENVPLQTQATKLVNEYDKLCGAMLVRFRGTEYTLQQLARFGEEPDRATRQEAWLAAEARRGQDRQGIDTLFGAVLGVRHQMARQADCPDFRAYVWKQYLRFDYSPEDCLRFADAIEETCLPLVAKLDEARRRELGLAMLRPWDMAVDPKGRPALRPFDPESPDPRKQIDAFVADTAAVFEALAPQLGRWFGLLKPGRNLDLASRKGKRPGGYQSSLEQAREPFIFMNAAGLQRDVETILHEGGHAFHYLAARDEPLIFLRSAPIEFCEVASMSMELLGDAHLGQYYGSSAAGQSDAARAKRVHLEGIVRLFPWVATIDCFQHWLYTHPGHSAQERTKAWLAVHRRFSSPLVDWSGLEEVRQRLWQRQPHLFAHPFYYVEYGIAQLGALGVWLNYRRDPADALGNLLSAFRLGGTRPLPELFQAAGVPFDFSTAAMQPLMQAIGDELAQLPP